MSPLVALLPLIASTIPVESAGPCPSAEEIALYQERLPSGVESGKPWRATVEQTSSDTLKVRAMLEGGSEEVERELPADASCSRRAEAVAVLLAAWESQLANRADVSAAVEPLSLESLTAVLEPEPAPAPPPPEPATPAVIQAAPPPPPPSAHATAFLGLSAGSAASQNGFGPFAQLDAVLGSNRSAFGGHVGASYDGMESVPLGPGRLTQRHVALSLGPALTARGDRFRGELRVDAVLAWMHLSTRGFTDNGSADAFRPGAAVSAWVFTRVGTTWLGLGAVGRSWFTGPRVRVSGVDETYEGSLFEGALALRLGWEL